MDQRNGERRGNQPEFHRNPRPRGAKLAFRRLCLSTSVVLRLFRLVRDLSIKQLLDFPLKNAEFYEIFLDPLIVAGFVKLYVVGVPRPAEEEDLTSQNNFHEMEYTPLSMGILQLLGYLPSVLVIYIGGVALSNVMPSAGFQCCFVKYRTLDEANRAIGSFNGRYTFPGGELPLTIRYADGERTPWNLG
ncbi:hypothetical protein HAX54_006551 [Datura stramonium]|uniref:RRM domain-containing protein n=1 Tax=Datura stramonium TaxID=4076 RepID=A0ABS8RUK6_DATST|nr:hypothetical protein [Datura stramonium]